MLQIITGKFFTTEDLYVTHQRGVLYTNYSALFYDPIETSVGSLLPVTTREGMSEGSVFSLIYEVDERLEKKMPDGQNSILVSVGADFLVQEFAAVTAFALNVICTPDLDLARRLTQSKHSSLGIPNVPSKYIGRVFDQQINSSQGDDVQLQGFIDDLVGLERRAYKAAMRAIRRYVNGLHRLVDDLDLAYALLVASIESLAQEFDAFEPTWDDYEQGKRAAFDEALVGASSETVTKVQDTILEHEHVALARRYREFTLAHLQPSFFREEAAKEVQPVRRSDLPRALERAYQFRSKYVHTLRELPRLLTAVPAHNDVLIVEGKPALTFHGLARIARHVISQFIAHALKVEREAFDYREDLPNTIRAPLAEQYWIWQPEGYDYISARRYLSGFLSELSAILNSVPDAKITDISLVLEKIETCVRGLNKAEQRLPMLTLYLLFHHHLAPKCHRPNWERLIEKHSEDFDVPSAESLLAHVLTGNEPKWTPEQCVKVHDDYFKQRYNKKGLAFGALFETAVTLSLAEIYRKAGNEVRAQEFVSKAVENLPGHQRLLEFERNETESPLPAIEWWELLLPANTADPTDKVESDQEAEQ